MQCWMDLFPVSKFTIRVNYIYVVRILYVNDEDGSKSYSSNDFTDENAVSKFV